MFIRGGGIVLRSQMGGLETKLVMWRNGRGSDNIGNMGIDLLLFVICRHIIPPESLNHGFLASANNAWKVTSLKQ